MMQRFLIFTTVLVLSTLSAFGGTYPRQGFIPNAGQWDAAVKYRLGIPGGAAFIRNTGISYILYDAGRIHEIHEMSHQGEQLSPGSTIRHQGIHMNLLGASNPSGTEIFEPSSTQYNYYLGNNKAKHARGLHAYKELLMKDVYPSTDWKVRMTETGMKYDFIVHPGAQPELIRMNFKGASGLEVINNTLYIRTVFGEIVEQTPVAWQDGPNGRVLVDCAFQLIDNETIGFQMGSFDPALELTIDPDLVFASYSGSSDDNWGFTATFDNSENAYSGGIVFGTQFSTNEGVYQEEFGGGTIDIGIIKYNPTGVDALYITYLGGSGVEFPHSMIVNEYDELIVFGTTGSANFPVTNGAASTTFQGGASTQVVNIPVPQGLDIFVARFSEDGDDLLASTFVGGTGNDGFNGNSTLIKNYADEIRGALWVDRDNNVYVGTSTTSSDFPVGNNAIQNTLQGSQDGVVIKLNGNLSQLLWSTYLGGSAADGIFYLVVDEEERVIVTGGTASSDFPLTAGCWQNTYGGGVSDGFVSIIDSAGTGLIASTFIGSSSYDMSFIVGADKSDFVYIFAQTSHPGDLFNLNSPIGVSGGNQFLMKLNPSLSEVIWSSPYGNATGQPDISPTALLVDYCDKIYCTGWGGAVNGQLGTNTVGLPVTPDAWQLTTDGSDFHLYVIDDVAENILYASFLGGTSSPDHVDGGTSRFDRKGVIYQSICAGCGGSSDFPIDGQVYANTNNSSNCNNLLAKFDFESPLTISAIATVSEPLGCAPYTVFFNNTSINADEFSWRVLGEEIGNTQTLEYTFEQPGTYEVELIATSSVSCNGADTVSVTINVLEEIQADLPTLTICPGNSVEIGPDVFDDPYFEFNWFPNTGLSEDDVRKPIATPLVSTLYSVEIRVGGCVDTLTQQVNIGTGQNITLPEIDACALRNITLGPEDPYIGNVVYSWSPQGVLSADNIYNPTYFTESPETFTLLVDLGNGCADTLTQFVNARFDLMDAGPDKEVCIGDTVEIGFPDASGDFTYQWTPSLGLSDAQISNPNVAVNESTSYELFRTPLPGTLECPARDIVNISIVERPLALFDFEVFANCEGASVVLNNQSENNQENLWEFEPGQPSTESNPIVLVPFNQNFIATLIVANGECRDTTSLSEFIKDFNDYFKENDANAFSPNGDGINDCFNPALQLAPPPYDRAFLECTDLYVYNRWGELVHSSVNDNEPCWLGTNLGGEDLPEGVYFYIFEYVNEKRAGVVHLKRQ